VNCNLISTKMFPLYHSSGFYCAPVSKVILFFLILSCLLVTFPFLHYKKWFNITYHSIWEQMHISQLISSHLVFTDPKDVTCAAILFYHFRLFERRFGSSKFCSQLLGSFILSLGLFALFLWLFHLMNIDIDPLPSGPFGPLFSLFIPYYNIIPRVAITKVMGIPLTGKSFNYIIGLHLASGSVETLILAVIGIVAGILYACNFMGIQNLQIPSLFSQMCFKLLGKAIITKTPDEDVPFGATLEIQRVEQMEIFEQRQLQGQIQQSLMNVTRNRGFAGNLFNFSGTSAPPENQIQQLVDMGFSRDHVLNALRLSNNDTSIATNFLLTSS